MSETNYKTGELTLLKPHKRTDTCYAHAMTSAEWQEIVEAQSFRCFYCGKFIDLSAEPDHLVPVSQDGCTCSGNVVASCAGCNALKSGRTVEEFFKDRPSYLQKAGEFSTRILYLRRSPALFWNHLSVQLKEKYAELNQKKDMNRALGIRDWRKKGKIA